MALSYGALLMGKHKKADLKAIQDEARKQQRRMKKRGLWSSIGRTLGSFAAPMAMGALGLGGGPLGLLAGKMVMGRLGAEAGEKLGGVGRIGGGDVSKKAMREAGTHGFFKDEASEYADMLGEAQSGLDKQQWMTSIMNPVIETGGQEVLGQLQKAGGDLWGKYQAGKTGELLGKKVPISDFSYQTPSYRSGAESLDPYMLGTMEEEYYRNIGKD